MFAFPVKSNAFVPHVRQLQNVCPLHPLLLVPMAAKKLILLMTMIDV
jgi:hypothetical protein